MKTTTSNRIDTLFRKTRITNISKEVKEKINMIKNNYFIITTIGNMNYLQIIEFKKIHVEKQECVKNIYHHLFHLYVVEINLNYI